MEPKKRTAVLGAVILLSLLCLGIDNPFSSSKTSRSEMAARVESLEKQNAELRKQMSDLSVKVDLLTQRVNNVCSGQGDGAAFPQGQSIISGPIPELPDLDMVRLSPDAQPPDKPKGRLIITRSDEESSTLMEHRAPLPGTNYVPLPDPETALVREGSPTPAPPKESRTEDETMATRIDNPAEPKPVASASELASYQKIKELMDGGKSSEALPLMEEYLKTYSAGIHEDEVAFWLGQYRISAADYSKAIEAFRIVTEQHPESARAPEALYQVGLCCLELGRDEDAAKALQEVKILYPFSDAAQKAQDKLAACCQ